MSGKIKLVPPEGVTSASWDGQEYKVDKDGICEVPAEAALTLYGFGFGNAPAAPAKPETAAERKAREKAEAEAKAAEEAAAAEAATAAGNDSAPAAPAEGQ